MKLKQSALDKAFAVTSYFEGGYTAIAGNSDGQGLSLGFLQWNFGQGTLQSLLLRVFNEFSQLTELMPENGKWLLGSLNNGWIMDWAAQIQDNNKVVGPWRDALYNLCCTPEFQKIQQDAAQEYVDYAVNMCNQFGLTTDRAFALMFDIAVQCGPMNGYDLAEPTYIEKLAAVANAAANKCNPRWQDDVRNRKLAIVYGQNMGRGWAGVEFNDYQAFEDETAPHPEPVQELPAQKDWKTVLTEKLDEPDKWIKAVEAAQADSDLGDMEIIKYLPELIVKIGG